MYEDCSVKLKMDRSILMNGEIDEKVYDGTVIRYIPDEEYMFLSVKPELVNVINLDAVYECRIETKDEEQICLGVVRDRYWNKNGGVLKYMIRNGFYKTRIK